jgi:hypothetical protein
MASSSRYGGIIMKETIGSHGKIYVLFESDGKTSVLNKLALENIGEDSRAWSTSRNNIKIGRLVRSKSKWCKFYRKDIETLLINIRRHLTFQKYD